MEKHAAQQNIPDLKPAIVESTTIPRSMMVYARFMRDTGLIKRAPDTVGELFFALPQGGS